MPKAVALEFLKKYLPAGTYPLVASYLTRYKVSLTITRRRRSILGDYRRPHKEEGHRISVNGDLNKYAFLLTVMHELAHLMAFEFYGSRIAPHGKEWKQVFNRLLQQLDLYAVFPREIAVAIQEYMKDPAARTCSDDRLVRTLRKYDRIRPDTCLVEDLAEGEHFLTPGGEPFCRGRKLRKRFECKSLRTGHLYIFSPLYEVRRITQ